MGAALIELKEAIAAWRGRPVLGPLDLRLEAGDFLGVVGPNGAGKTSLLRLLAGRLPLHGGQRVVSPPPAGQALTGAEERAWTRRAVGWLFQRQEDPGQVPFTVRDVVGFARVGAAASGDGEAVSEAMALLGILPLADRLYRELSGGEQQKVHLARLCARHPELYLLDEPTAGLDLDWQERLTQLVETLYRHSGRTVVMVTHDVDRLPACCRRVLLLKHGRCVALGAPADVLTADTLSGLYDCPMVVVGRGGRFHAFSETDGMRT